MSTEVEIYKPEHHIRIITATSLFDGHDAAINIMRRIIQETGVEVIHLGHNRSVLDIVDAAGTAQRHPPFVVDVQSFHFDFRRDTAGFDIERRQPVPINVRSSATCSLPAVCANRPRVCRQEGAAATAG